VDIEKGVDHVTAMAKAIDEHLVEDVSAVSCFSISTML
jgi:hypothetical protein